eukprot:14413750-Alexandrium_andersonii.AAC.1
MAIAARNGPLARLGRRPELYKDEAAAPEGPRGEAAVSTARNRLIVGGSVSCGAGRRGRRAS